MISISFLIVYLLSFIFFGHLLPTFTSQVPNMDNKPDGLLYKVLIIIRRRKRKPPSPNPEKEETEKGEGYRRTGAN